MSCCQWRSRMAGWCRSDTSGKDVSMALSVSSRSLHMRMTVMGLLEALKAEQGAAGSQVGGCLFKPL